MPPVSRFFLRRESLEWLPNNSRSAIPVPNSLRACSTVSRVPLKTGLPIISIRNPPTDDSTGIAPT